jgi:predicted NBD/HSP70 family sugar kinase
MHSESPSNPPGRPGGPRTLFGSLSGTNLERAGDHNQRVTLQAIRVNQSITRAELAELTGLTAPAIANITKRLLDEGLILEAGRIYGARGQPAMRLAINPDGCFSIGVNIDRDHITFVVLDLMGQVRARAVQEVDFALPPAVAQFFRKQVDEALKKSIPKARIIGVGVALPDDLGRVNLPHRPPTYEVWNSVDVPKLFGDILPLPVFTENDAAAAAMGEMQFGHGLKSPTFFYVLISAALGGGLVIEGNYFRGANGRSGELGFLPIRSRESDARSLQEVVSLSALYERLKAAGFKVGTPEDLSTLDKEGRAVISRWVDLSAELLAEPLIAVNCLVNPEAVFLGGRLPADIVDKLAERLNRLLAQQGADVPSIAPVKIAAMAADAPAVGAAILPINNQLLPSRGVLSLT